MATSRNLSGQRGGRETAGNRCLPAILLRLLPCLLALLLAVYSPALALPAYADIDPESAEGAIPEADSYNDELALAQAQRPVEQLQLTFSTPEVWEKDDRVFYRAQLGVKGVTAIFGYQIQIEAADPENITLKNLANGVATAPTFKDGSVYFAVIATEQMSGDVALCEISGSFPAGTKNADKNLVVRTLHAVTNINTNSIVTLGPEPAAAILSLAYIEAGAVPLVIMVSEAASVIPIWLYAVLVMATATALALTIARLRRQRQRQHQHSRGLHSR
ncbi:MAG: hypothetical protein FWF91_05515 [Coriobacteriia bacterium]|nr:hypothetical protein [Coriobacteriia bacterium]